MNNELIESAIELKLFNRLLNGVHFECIECLIHVYSHCADSIELLIFKQKR